MWTLPDPSILEHAERTEGDKTQIEHIGSLLTEKLDELRARCEVEDYTVGPQVIRYEMTPAEGVSMRSLPRHAQDLAYEIAAETVRIEAPIPGRRAVGVEVPNPDRRTVKLGSVMSSARAPLSFALGEGMNGESVGVDLAQMPHLLIAGQTGAGKSNTVNAALCSLLMKSTPEQLRLVLIDTKMVEFGTYSDIPHLAYPIVDSSNEAIYVLHLLVQEMESRYRLAAQYGVRELTELNACLPASEQLPRIVLAIDELADLMMSSRREVEEAIVRIAQKARAVGIHLILSTQTPRREVLTGLIKANIPARISCSVASALDSRIVLDRNGGERLLGKGDLLFLSNGSNTPIRVQGAYVSDGEMKSITDHWRAQSLPIYTLQETTPEIKEYDMDAWREEFRRGSNEAAANWLEHNYATNGI